MHQLAQGHAYPPCSVKLGSPWSHCGATFATF